jgi:hypothetical protein
MKSLQSVKCMQRGFTSSIDFWTAVRKVDTQFISSMMITVTCKMWYHIINEKLIIIIINNDVYFYFLQFWKM